MTINFSSDEEKHAAGFVLNKLYSWKYFAKEGNLHHGGHSEVTNMPKSYPPSKRGLIHSAIEKMNGKLVVVFKATGEEHISALNDDAAIREGLELCNAYRKSQGLPPLDRYFKEIIEEKKSEAKKDDWKPMSDKEKRGKDYLESVKKWMVDQGYRSEN